LKVRKDGNDFAIGFDDLRRDGGAGTVFGEEFEERGVAEVFLEIGTLAEILGIDLRDGETVPVKMFGEFEEGDVFFADAVEYADGAVRAGGKADDFAAGAAEFALERLDALDRQVKMLLEQRFENVYGHSFQPNRFDESMEQTIF
jgi:hypothetical protein